MGCLTSEDSQQLKKDIKQCRQLVGKVFEGYGEIVGLFPWPFIFIPIVISLALGAGCFYVTVEDDIRFLYSPLDSPSRWEYSVHQEFSGEDRDSTFLALALVSANQTTNMLTSQRTDLITSINEFVLKNLTFDIRGMQYNFGRDVCPKITFCPDSNQVLEKFLIVYWNQSLTENPLVSLNYPIMKLFDSKFFLPGYLYGVKTNESNGRILSAKMVHMTYPVPATEGFSAEDIAQAFEGSLVNYLNSQMKKAHMSISIFSIHILKHELAKNTYYTLPYISVTIVLLVSFTIVSCMTSDIITSKPIEALMGVASSGLAILSAGGLMFFMGVPFITQVTVMPFIALAIGVDDTYIILGAWQRTSRSLKPHRRLALTMKEAGSAITVTSITDCLSFGIGAFSPTPAIAIFCKFTAAAIFFDFAYQITFFAAVVSVGGQRESQGKHAVLFWKEVDEKLKEHVRSKEHCCPIQSFFGNYYAAMINHWIVRSIVLGTYVIYVFIAIKGCAKLKANLTPSTLLVDDSPLKEYIRLAETHMWSEGLMGRVYVNQAPDFSKGPHEVDKFLGFVQELESTKYSIGRNSTQLWLRDYLNYWQYFPQDYDRFYYDLSQYVNVDFNSQWRTFLKWTEGRKNVNKFFFTTGFQVEEWSNRTDLLLNWRNVTNKYPEYEAVVYDENNFYSDQVLSLPDTAMQAMGIALIFMFLVCAVFINEITTVYWVCFTMLSMDLGIIGYLSHWGSDLSPTTILNMLMSIGLSVDFATHVGYKYYRVKTTYSSGDPTADLNYKMQETLGSIAWPVLQGGLSTFLAVFSLQFVKSFVVRIFFRTIVLVVSLGLYHGLILLPVVLRTITNVQSMVTQSTRRQYSASFQENAINHRRKKKTSNSSISTNSDSSSSNMTAGTINSDSSAQQSILNNGLKRRAMLVAAKSSPPGRHISKSKNGPQNQIAPKWTTQPVPNNGVEDEGGVEIQKGATSPIDHNGYRINNDCNNKQGDQQQQNQNPNQGIIIAAKNNIGIKNVNLVNDQQSSINNHNGDKLFYW